jgi:hypothetical protein
MGKSGPCLISVKWGKGHKRTSVFHNVALKFGSEVYIHTRNHYCNV